MPSDSYSIPNRRMTAGVVGLPEIWETPVRTGNLIDPNGPLVLKSVHLRAPWPRAVAEYMEESASLSKIVIEVRQADGSQDRSWFSSPPRP
jgi:hypothetical protein